jgi:glycosyltransferase involved in cell wall biosynthesis
MHWAFEAMKRCGYMDAFEWVVVANKVDPGIQALAPSNVRFASHLSNDALASIFGDSDLFVMPSLVEGFGLVYIEALSKGLPVVYTENTGPDDFCIDGVHGFKVDCGSLDSMVALFKRLVEESVDLGGMRPACTALAQNTNWENFRSKIGNFVINK